MIEKLIMETFLGKTLQSGGMHRRAHVHATGNMDVGTWLILITLSVIFFTIRSYIVQSMYNYVVPKLMEKNGADVSNFRQLTLTEAMALLLLVSVLVGN